MPKEGEKEKVRDPQAGKEEEPHGDWVRNAVISVPESQVKSAV